MKKLSCMAALLATCFSAQAAWVTTDLGSLGGTSTAKGISVYNRVVGGSTNSQQTLYAPFTATPAGIQAINVPGLVSGEAMAANASGQVVGYANKANGGSSAFLYSNGVVKEIVQAGYLTTATHINHAGQVAGMIESAWDQPIELSGFLYSRGSISKISMGGEQTYVYGMNASGQVTGEGYFANRVRAYIFGDGVVTDLGTLPGGDHSGGVTINDAGQVAGWGYNAAGEIRAVRYSDGVMSDLGTLGGKYSWATAINGAGLVVGYADLATNGYHAFVSNGTQMTDLGTLGGAYSYATGINSVGQIVGVSALADGSSSPFFYDNGTMYNISDLVTGFGNLHHEVYLNDSGQITGSGWINGKSHAFLLTYVPDTASPSSALAPTTLVMKADAEASPRAPASGGKQSSAAMPQPPGIVAPPGMKCPPPYCVPATKKPGK
jgi:probable HAF family extracellular repeat protein